MSTLERIEELEKQSLETNRTLEALSQFCQQVAQKTQGIETSATQIAKTLSAISKYLTEKDVLDDKEVMKIMREGDEREVKAQISGLVNAGIIVKSPVVGLDSIVIVKNMLIDPKSGDFELLSGYTPLEMSREDIPQNIKQELFGKKVKDTYSFTDRPEVLSILEIYDAVEIKTEEGPKEESPPEDKPEEETAEVPSEV